MVSFANWHRSTPTFCSLLIPLQRKSNKSSAFHTFNQQPWRQRRSRTDVPQQPTCARGRNHRRRILRRARYPRSEREHSSTQGVASFQRGGIHEIQARSLTRTCGMQARRIPYRTRRSHREMQKMRSEHGKRRRRKREMPHVPGIASTESRKRGGVLVQGARREGTAEQQMRAMCERQLCRRGRRAVPAVWCR